MSAKGHGRVDLDRLRREASILALLPAGTKVHRVNDGHWRTQCPLHGGDGLSLGVWFGRWGWSFNCFACNEQGQVIDFAMKLHGLDFKGAVDRLGGGQLEAAPAMPAWQPPKKSHVIACVGRGCGERLEVDLSEVPFLGVALHNAWTFAIDREAGEVVDVRGRCPKCTRVAAFGTGDRELLARASRLLFHALKAAREQREHQPRRAA